MGDQNPHDEAIEARTAAIVQEHNLSKARAEGVELALRDLAERGEWPPAEPEAAEPDPAPSDKDAWIDRAARVGCLKANQVAMLRALM